MPRCTISAIIRSAGEMTSSTQNWAISGKLRTSDIISLRMPGGAGLADPFPPEAQHVGEQLGGAALEGADDLHALGDLVHHVVADHFLEQLFLARVVEVERALGHAGARGDLLGAGGGEALLDEQVEGGVEQLLGPRFLAPLAERGAERSPAKRRAGSWSKVLTDWSVM